LPSWATVQQPYYYSNVSLAQNTNTVSTGISQTVWRTTNTYPLSAGQSFISRFSLTNNGAVAGNVVLSLIIQINTDSAFPGGSTTTLTSGQAFVMEAFGSTVTGVFNTLAFVPASVTTGNYFIRARLLVQSAGFTGIVFTTGNTSLQFIPGLLAA
jgi:hypothetical protein